MVVRVAAFVAAVVLAVKLAVMVVRVAAFVAAVVLVFKLAVTVAARGGDAGLDPRGPTAQLMLLHVKLCKADWAHTGTVMRRPSFAFLARHTLSVAIMAPTRSG